MRDEDMQWAANKAEQLRKNLPAKLTGSAAPLENTPGTPEYEAKDAHLKRQIMAYRLSGLSHDEIANQLSISVDRVTRLVTSSLAASKASSGDVDTMRELENQRLDRAQAALWSRVLNGDLKATEMLLKIQEHRSKINGLDAPQKVELAVDVRRDMDQAFSELEDLMQRQTEVIDAELEEVPPEALESADHFPDPTIESLTEQQPTSKEFLDLVGDSLDENHG